MSRDDVSPQAGPTPQEEQTPQEELNLQKDTNGQEEQELVSPDELALYEQQGSKGESGLLPLWFPYPAFKPVKLLPPLVLAYIGDAVFEVAVRQYLISRPKLKPHHLHVQATRFVAAKSQARLLTLIDPQLTAEEQDVVRQGRNAKSGSVPKNADVLDYRHATALEALVGFLYYSGRHERLQQLLDQGMKLLEEI